jgi:general secretion pathway protein A
VSPPARPPYLAHWGLAEPPFLLDPDPRFAYERPDHREGLARILFGLTELSGLVVITGEIGCGKTMLVRSLAGTLRGEGFLLVSVANPPRTPAALMGALLGALNGETPGGATARLAGRLRDRLAAEADAGRRAVLAVDEAQRLDPRALEEVRLLTNPGDAPGLPVVLLGQPELTAHIARTPQVAQRVVVRYHLRPMSAPEVASYIAHRTRVAGASRPLFSERAALAVHERTGGVPRLVNLLCANALFVGYARAEEVVGEDTIRDLAEDRAADEAPDAPGAEA